MKNITLLVFSLSLFSCYKQDDILFEKKYPFATVVKKTVPVEKIFDWNNKKISCWGDSFTEAPGAASFSRYLADMLKTEVFNGGVSGQISTQIRDRFLADTVHNKDCAIIWIGRNNFWWWQNVLNDIDTIVARLPHKRYLVLGILNGDWDNGDWGEWKQSTWNGGYSFYKHLTWFNDTMAFKYKTHFIDVHAMLMTKANKSPEDSICVYHDVTPKSLRVDELHLNSLGQQYVAEEIVATLNRNNK